MGTADVYEFLEKEYLKNPEKYFSVREISNGVNIGEASISTNLKKMRKTRMVAFDVICQKGRTGSRYKYRSILANDTSPLAF